MVNAGWPATCDKGGDKVLLCDNNEKNPIFECVQNVDGGWVIRFHMKNVAGKWMIGKVGNFDDLKSSWRRRVLCDEQGAMLWRF
jgi:hypothetical protein